MPTVNEYSLGGFPSFSSQQVSSPNTSKQTESFNLAPLFHESMSGSNVESQRKLNERGSSQVETLDEQIESSLQELQQVTENMQLLQDQAKTSSSSQTIVKFIQIWVADFILKGGTAIARSGLPFMVHSSEALGTLNPTLGTINIVTDLMDSSAGVIGFIYQYRALQVARQGLAEMKANADQLDSHQKIRLAQLEKLIKYEESLLPLRAVEQLFRVFRNGFSFARLVFSGHVAPLAASLAAGANALIGGLDAALYGLFFYQAHQNVKGVRSWSQKFKTWINQTTLSIDKSALKDPAAVKQISETVDRFKEKRMKREQSQLQHLKEQIAKKEISMETIRRRIEKFKSPTWVAQQSEESLLSQYVDYHSVLDTTVKGALTEMVKKKHKIEKGLLKVQRNILGTRFTIATVIFGVALSLAIVGLAANPVGAAGLILLILTVSSITLGLGLTGAGYYYAHQQKPRITAATLKGAYFRLFFYQTVAQFLSVKERIGDYLDTAWQNKRNQLIALIGKQTLFQRKVSQKDEDIKEIIVKETIEADYQKAQSKAQEWNHKALQFQKELDEKSWADFAEKADLKIANPQQTFDTLEVLKEALSACDLYLLSDETRELLEKQFGINIHSLQMEIAKDPSSIKKLLQNFFNLDNVNFIRFVGQQA